MDKDSLSDERLVALHQQKKINAFFTIYNRYKHYGYAIIYRQLLKTPYLNALYDERDAILYDAIMDMIEVYDKSRGTVRALLSSILEHATLNCIKEYRKNPLADSISLEDDVDNYHDLKFIDTLTFADRNDSPPEFVNKQEINGQVENVYHARNQKKAQKMIKLKEQGYSVNEIATIFNCSVKSVRSFFYRIKKQVNGKESRKRQK